MHESSGIAIRCLRITICRDGPLLTKVLRPERLGILHLSSLIRQGFAIDVFSRDDFQLNKPTLHLEHKL